MTQNSATSILNTLIKSGTSHCRLVGELQRIPERAFGKIIINREHYPENLRKEVYEKYHVYESELPRQVQHSTLVEFTWKGKIGQHGAGDPIAVDLEPIDEDTYKSFIRGLSDSDSDLKLLVIRSELKDIERKKENTKEELTLLQEKHKKQQKNHEKQLKEFRAEAEKLNQSKKSSEEQIASLSENIKDLQSTISEKREDLQEFLKKTQTQLTPLLDLGIQIPTFASLPKNTNETKHTRQFEGNFPQLISYIQSALAEQNIYYRRSTLETFLALLRTNELVILAGASGTGKTHLVRSVAEALGGVAHIIPVKPNWMSSRDLLGYENSITGNYVYTEFLDALLQASEEPETLHFVCLDEMNIARIEHYFADFLSAMEDRKNPTIQLYSDRGNKKGEAIKNLIERLNLPREQALQQPFQTQDVQRASFPEPTIQIPENIRFFGTVNIDATTHYLSPKVLDRAFIMRLESPLIAWEAESTRLLQRELEQAEKDLKQAGVSISQTIRLSANSLRVDIPNELNQQHFEEKVIQTLMGWNRDFLEPLGVGIGYRVLLHTKQIHTSYKEILSKDDQTHLEDITLNSIVQQKLLPRLSFDGRKRTMVRGADGLLRRHELIYHFLDSLQKKIQGLKFLSTRGVHCVDELKMMHTYAEEVESRYNYWDDTLSIYRGIPRDQKKQQA